MEIIMLFDPEWAEFVYKKIIQGRNGLKDDSVTLL
jgi:hypothetical protein